MWLIFRLAFLGSTGLFFVAGAATPQGTENRNCRDDTGVNRCAEEQQRRVRTLFGVGSIEEHRAAGDQVLRIFYVDGYGRDLILIAFVRTPGRDPTLWVHHPPRDGEPRPQPFQMPVSQAIWNEVVQRSANFDRTFTPRPGTDPSTIGICLHSWVYTIEAVGRSRGRLPSELRRKTEDACEDGPGSAYALELQRIALSLIPHCAALDPAQHRNPATMLAACRILHGDRLAAAEVLNLAGPFRHVRGAEARPRIAGLFAHETRIDWNGARYQGQGVNAAPFWIAQLGEETTNFYFHSVNAQNADRASLTGQLSRSVDLPGGTVRSETAQVEQIWVRDFNGDMRLENATIGPWRPEGSS
ncbi:MAG TPA: hypothetical protein VEW71_02865 [Allosphingosinicella sp.]|nr:hypothetical protein [Allosphingosinicella sp.]